LEAHAIAVALENISITRPLTHDLMKNICANLGVKISHVVITDLQENTFYAEIYLHQSDKDKEMVIDSRPSDVCSFSVAHSRAGISF